MYSRKPMERNLLHRLSHITDIQKQTVLQSRDIKDARMESMSMQPPIAFYMQGIMAEGIPQPKQKKRVFGRKEQAEEERHQAMAIMEV